MFATATSYIWNVWLLRYPSEAFGLGPLETDLGFNATKQTSIPWNCLVSKDSSWQLCSGWAGKNQFQLGAVETPVQVSWRWCYQYNALEHRRYLLSLPATRQHVLDEIWDTDGMPPNCLQNGCFKWKVCCKLLKEHRYQSEPASWVLHLKKGKHVANSLDCPSHMWACLSKENLGMDYFPGVPGSSAWYVDGRNLAITSWDQRYQPWWQLDFWTIKRYCWGFRNPVNSPVDMENIPLFAWLYTSLVVGNGISEPSIGINRYSTKLLTILVFSLWSYVRLWWNLYSSISMARTFEVLCHSLPWTNWQYIVCDIIGRCCKLFTQTVKQTEHNMPEWDPHVRSSLLRLFLQHSSGKWH